MAGVATGDCVIDSSGCVGIVFDSSAPDDVLYKVTAFDGMEIKYNSPELYLKVTTAQFKKAYLKELRRIHANAEQFEE